MDYSLTIFPLITIRYHYDRLIPTIRSEYRVQFNEQEIVYDWLVNEALYCVLQMKQKVEIVNRYQHDVYSCIYAEAGIGYEFEHWLSQILEDQKFTPYFNEQLKTLVAGNSLIIARGILNHARV